MEKEARIQINLPNHIITRYLGQSNPQGYVSISFTGKISGVLSALELMC
jgi:hypothetical protein